MAINFRDIRCNKEVAPGRAIGGLRAWRDSHALGVAPMVAWPVQLGFPPDNIEVYSGEWGQDFDEDLTNVNSSSRSIIFYDTWPTADAAIQTEQFIEVGEDVNYLARYTLASSSNDFGAALKPEIVWFDADQQFLSVSQWINASLAEVNTWTPLVGFFQAPTGARFAKLRLTKQAGAFCAWLDAWDLEVAPITSAVYSAVTGPVIPTGSETVVLLDTTAPGITYDGAGVSTLVGAGGSYRFDVSMAIDSMTNGASLTVKVYVSSRYGIAYDSATGAYKLTVSPSADVWGSNTVYNNTGATNRVQATISFMQYMQTNSQFYVTVTHDHGSDKSINTAKNCSFIHVSAIK